MKVGDVIRFKPTGIIGTIVGIKHGHAWADVEVIHSVENVSSPTVFSMVELSRVAEVISAS